MNNDKRLLIIINEVKILFLFSLSCFDFDINAFKEDKNDDYLIVIYKFNNININDNNEDEDNLKIN